jgi:hypothetical protein
MRSTAVISKSFLFPQIPILLFSSSENQRKFESLEFICVLFYLQDRLDFVWSQRLVRCLMTTFTVLTEIAWRTLALECLDCILSLEFLQVSYEQGWSDSSSWTEVIYSIAEEETCYPVLDLYCCVDYAAKRWRKSSTQDFRYNQAAIGNRK